MGLAQWILTVIPGQWKRHHREDADKLIKAIQTADNFQAMRDAFNPELVARAGKAGFFGAVSSAQAEFEIHEVVAVDAPAPM